MRKELLSAVILLAGVTSCGGNDTPAQCDDTPCTSGDTTKTFQTCCNGDSDSSSCALTLGPDQCTCTVTPADPMVNCCAQQITDYCDQASP